MSDAHLVKASVKGYSGDWTPEYYNYEGQDWWEGANLPAYSSSSIGELGYYGEYADSEWDNVEIDLFDMVFVLGEKLEPQDLYAGLHVDEKSLVVVLQEADLEDKSPASWLSRPLKIHPEPQRRAESKASPATVTAATPDAASSQGRQHTEGTPSRQIPDATPSNGSQSRQQKVKDRDKDFVSPQASPASAPKTPAQAGPASADGGGAGAGVGASPKIVISNSQLEHLKQKMQALKQQRTPTPPPTPVAPVTEERVDVTPADKPVAAPAVTSDCPARHGLRFFRTPDNGWWCSVCRREHPKGSPFYGCRACNYDECEVCALAPREERDNDGHPSRDVVERSDRSSGEADAPRDSTRESARESRRGSRESRLAPRERRSPRKDFREKDNGRASGSKRRAAAAPERPASRSRESSEEPPQPKKRVVNALSVDEPRTGTVSLVRAAARVDERSGQGEDRRRRSDGRRGPGGGDDLLRRVLRAAGQQAPKRDERANEPRARLLPPEDVPQNGAGSPNSAPAAMLKPPPSSSGRLSLAPPQGIRKALEEFACQADRK